MDLQEKLEEIRRKPKHIRLRYTYIAVVISMFFILLLWGFSLTDSIKKSTIKKQNVFEGLNEEKKSLKEASDDIRKSLNDLKEEAASFNNPPAETETNDSAVSPNLPKNETETTDQPLIEKNTPSLDNSVRPMPDIINP